MDIPEDISVDLFGEIYEYFLGEFALQEGKDGGTFYTPATVVRYMVEVLNPEMVIKDLRSCLWLWWHVCASSSLYAQP